MGARSSDPRRVDASTEIPAYFLYGNPLGTADERIVHIEPIASRSKLHHWEAKPHRHSDMYQILLLEAGSVVAAIDTRSADLRAPAAFIAPPGSVHSFQFRQDAGGLAITFGAGLIRRLASTTPAILDTLHRPWLCALDRAALKATDLKHLARILAKEFSRSPSGRGLALYGLLTALLCNLVRLLPSEKADNRIIAHGEQEIVTRFRQMLESSYRQHVGISSYARKLGVSEALLRRACRAVVGQSPVLIVHQRLLVEAERHLRFTPMTIKQIASSLGFNDPAYFTRFFTQYMRVSPRTFRDGLGSLIGIHAHDRK
jgi:AraC family transcriptional activator of pobA